MSTFDQSHQRLRDQLNIGIHLNETPSPEDLFKRGVRAYQERLYFRAVEFLTSAIVAGIENPDAHYYIALARLKGRRPRQFEADKLDLFEEIESHLLSAIKGRPSCPHVYTLWRPIREEYFERYGYHSRAPAANDLQEWSRGISVVHAAELLFLADDYFDPAWTKLLDEVDADELNFKQRRERVAKYFIPTPLAPDHWVTYRQYVLAVLAVVGGLTMAFWLAVHVLLILVVCVVVSVLLAGFGWLEYRRVEREYWVRFNAAEPKATDDQMDNWLRLGEARVIKAALRALHRDPSELVSDPLVVVGPREGADSAVGEDGQIRFSHYIFVVMVFTRRRVATYECNYNLITARTSSPRTYDCRQADVIGIATERARVRIIDSHTATYRMPTFEIFDVRVRGNYSISLAVDIFNEDDIRQSTWHSSASAATRALRAMLDQNR